MALFEVLLRQVYQGQECLNRFHYSGSGTPAAVSMSFALTDALGFIDVAGSYDATKLFAKLMNAQNAALDYVEVQARNLYSETDFYSRPWSPPLGADGGGEAASPLLAYGVQSNRTRLDVRRGSKRFAGVSEADVDAGGILGAGALSRWSDIAAEMSDVQTYDDEGNTLTFAPVVLSFEKYTTPSGKDAYRQYATLAAQEAHMATGIVYAVQAQVRSQTSRQYGRGR